MSIRITCDLPDHGSLWAEFRGDKWTFGDRRAVNESVSDLDWLAVVLGYVTAWNLTDVDGASVEPKTSAIDRVEDDLIAWLLSAWLKARSERSALPRKPSG